MNSHLHGLRRLFQEHSNALSPEGLSQFNALVAKTGAEVFLIAQKFVPQLNTTSRSRRNLTPDLAP